MCRQPQRLHDQLREILLQLQSDRGHRGIPRHVAPLEGIAAQVVQFILLRKLDPMDVLVSRRSHRPIVHVQQVRERLLILPIIGVLDGQRARQLTEQLLRAIRANRAKVVVIDITGVPAMDSTVANHLVQTVEASGLMGANVIITGLSSEIALTLVTIGVDLSKMNAVGDLQGGIEEAERLLGYEVTRSGEPALDIR